MIKIEEMVLEIIKRLDYDLYKEVKDDSETLSELKEIVEKYLDN